MIVPCTSVVAIIFNELMLETISWSQNDFLLTLVKNDCSAGIQKYPEFAGISFFIWCWVNDVLGLRECLRFTFHSLCCERRLYFFTKMDRFESSWGYKLQGSGIKGTKQNAFFHELWVHAYRMLFAVMKSSSLDVRILSRECGFE